MDDHGAINFEDEHASLPIPSGNEEHESWLTVLCKNNRQGEEYFDETFEPLSALLDIRNGAMERGLMLEASHSLRHTNIDVQNFLIMDFD